MAATKSMQEYIDMGLETYLHERVQDQESWMEGKSSSSKKNYHRVKLFVIILSVSIPFLVTMIDVYAYFKYIIAAVGVLIAAAEGILSLYDFQNEWIGYRQTLEALKREKFFFATKSSVYKRDSSFQFFVERIETILTTENKNWAESALSEIKVEKED
ncbi:MAG: DUF4231 domain-containing protein [Saprospiraceae bacterium]